MRDDSYESSSKYKSDQGDQKNNYPQVGGVRIGNKHIKREEYNLVFKNNAHPQDHRGIHQNYRDKDLSSRTRNDHVSKGKVCSSTAYRENYDQNHVQKSSSRPVNTSIRTRLPQKRVPNSVDRPLRDLSPKRIKVSNRNLQEVRTVDMLNNTNNDKKVYTHSYFISFPHIAYSSKINFYRMKKTTQKCRNIEKRWKNRNGLEKRSCGRRKIDEKWLQWRNKMMKLKAKIHVCIITFHYINQIYTNDLVINCLSTMDTFSKAMLKLSFFSNIFFLFYFFILLFKRVTISLSKYAEYLLKIILFFFFYYHN